MQQGMLSIDAFLLVIISTILIYCNGAPNIQTITLKQYTTIKIGWTQQQVTKLLGGPGNIISQSGKPGSANQVTTLRYSGVKSSKSFASFTFTGGSLDTKSQTGLDTGIYTITQQQYTAIQIAWTRNQVTNLVGSRGNTVAETGTGNFAVVIVQYTVGGTTYGVVNFGFVAGNVSSKYEVGFDSPVRNKITLRQYQTIQIGWTRLQVTKLLGGTGDIASQSGKPGSADEIISVQYSGVQSSYSLASFTFTGGSLDIKVQSGLDTGIYTITLKQYTTIKIGWTQQQVTKLLGSPGDIASQSGKPGSADEIISVQYSGVQSSYSLASFTFTGGSLDIKVQSGLDTGIYTITLKQYTTIKIGWTQQQVTKLLGGPGDIVSESGEPGSTDQITLVDYDGVQSSASSVSFTFVGGSLDTKSQVGLDTGIYTITPQQFTMIQIGWTRNQVTNFVGSPGDTVAETGTGDSAIALVRYTVTGTTYGSVSFTFVGENLDDKSIYDPK